jgi:uncharacterized membrane protein
MANPALREQTPSKVQRYSRNLAALIGSWNWILSQQILLSNLKS